MLFNPLKSELFANYFDVGIEKQRKNPKTYEYRFIDSICEGFALILVDDIQKQCHQNVKEFVWQGE